MTCNIFRFAKIATLCIALLKLGGFTRAIQSVATPRAKRVLQKGGGRILKQIANVPGNKESAVLLN